MNKVMTNFAKGMMVGIANVIPGVSGGTIAVVLGIFDQLIDSVNNFYKDFFKYCKFLVPLGLGMGTGILIFSNIITYFLENHSFPTSVFFVGLVVGSLPVIYKKAVSRKYGSRHYGATLAGIIVVIFIAALNADVSSAARTTVDFSTIATLFGGGFIAAAAMVVPGISGSFVMVLLGLYPTVMKAVATLNIPLLLPLAAGVGLGILAIAKLIEILLAKAFSVTYFTIMGLIIGSVYVLLSDPGTYATGFNTVGIIAAVISFITGFVFAFFLGRE